MPNYQNAKIYKIFSPSSPDLLPYYGATTQLLCRRMVGHRNECKKTYPCKSKNLIDCGDAKIVLIENYPCNSKEELSKKEAEYIVNNDCCNKQIPTRTPKEWREEHRDIIREKDKKYYQENRDKIREKTKQYHLQNRDIVLEKQNQYYYKNHTKIREQQQQNRGINNKSNPCDCGGRFTRINRTTHLKSIIHTNYINRLTDKITSSY